MNANQIKSKSRDTIRRVIPEVTVDLSSLQTVIRDVLCDPSIDPNYISAIRGSDHNVNFFLLKTWDFPMIAWKIAWHAAKAGLDLEYFNFDPLTKRGEMLLSQGRFFIKISSRFSPKTNKVKIAGSYR